MRSLLKFANTEAGRYLLNIPDTDRIVKLTKNSYHQLRDIQGDRAIIEAHFFTYPFVENILSPIETKMELAEEYKHIEKPYDAFLYYAGLQQNHQYPHIYLNLSTFTNSFSATGALYWSNANLATLRAGGASVNVISVSDGLNSYNCGFQYTFDSSVYIICRQWFHYDTSSLTGGATLMSSFIRFPGTVTQSANDNTDTLGVYASSVTSNTTIATSDWTNYGSTLFASLAFSSYNTAADNDLPLNASGLAAISKTDYTKLSTRTTGDTAASTPTGYNVKTANATGQLLSVTYSTGGAFIFNML